MGHNLHNYGLAWAAEDRRKKNREEMAQRKAYWAERLAAAKAAQKLSGAKLLASVGELVLQNNNELTEKSNALEAAAKAFAEKSNVLAKKASTLALQCRVALQARPPPLPSHRRVRAFYVKDPECLCCQKDMPIGIAEKSCPECLQVFNGNGWTGVDPHWKSERVGHLGVMPYDRFWNTLCSWHK